MGTRVPREMNMLSDQALKEPILTVKETKRVNNVIQWSRTHKSFMFSDWLASVLRLSEFVCDVEAFIVPRRPAGVTARLSIDQSPLAANTQGATPRKDQAHMVNNNKSKKVDKGKRKMIEPEKPKKLALQVGKAFKIYEPRAPVPPKPPVTQPAKKSPIPKKKPVETSPRVARILKLVDEDEDFKVQQPLETIPGFVSMALTPDEELEVEVIKAPLVRKRKLVKGVDVTAPEAESKNMANFMAA